MTMEEATKIIGWKEPMRIQNSIFCYTSLSSNLKTKEKEGEAEIPPKRLSTHSETGE